MGTWKIEISGHGIHHNSGPDDADAIARRMVADLRAAGHTVESATIIIVNQRDDVGVPVSARNAAADAHGSHDF